MGPGRDRKNDPWHHRGGHKASSLEPQSGSHGPFKGYFRRFHLSESTGECICSAGAQNTSQHVLEECEDHGRKEAREGLRRRQEAIWGAVHFRVTGLIKDEKARNLPSEENTSQHRVRTSTKFFAKLEYLYAIHDVLA
ncbi:hypothetical protein MTP99_013427 [Tenebrio molitor]|nr:hypothetical protein MTP99_013427 [Tenebrio molitor]